jgi:hypothetical protein
MALALTAVPAGATDQKDLVVGLKTFPLLDNKITGTAAAAIIFDPANPSSKADADSIKAAMGATAWPVAGVTLTPLMIPVSELAKLSQAKVAVVAQGTSASFGAIATAASSAGVLTMSTDLDCVKGGKCILGIVSNPTVEIYYSKAAGDAAKITFSPAFTMLVKQI